MQNPFTLENRMKTLVISASARDDGNSDLLARAAVGVVAQFQELTRYLNQDLVGVIVGRANSRGEIALDPSDPVSAASRLTERLYDTPVTDYRLDTVRSNKVWDHLRSVPPVAGT